MTSETPDPVMRPIPAVGTACFRGDDVLLIRRGTKPLAGDWSIPGGKLEFGESLADGALRELHEETGVIARMVGLVDVVDAIFTSRRTGDTARHYILFDYAAVWEAGEPIAGDDAAHAEWISPDRLATLGLWDETRRIIEAARALVGNGSIIA
ncbi:MAG: NUDIX hydrolase [Alphaproteobacteria bacterium]|nr:NUDIX hydrolase [Alphaproteobacteria bacterium]MBU2084016.1 NUDIX hydrolase [Alphaproteobacteria bacterium]MBU2144449.1 NUDIX hydrolase [Alphaproteobacteria bacterium]MBU2196293.1 NUDIX hydrolase [Alphaproteobacteria bacterium]